MAIYNWQTFSVQLQAENGTEFIIDGWNCYYFTFDSPHDLVSYYNVLYYDHYHLPMALVH